MDNATWLVSAYRILKRFLAIARREHELLALGQCSKLIWLTNDENSIRASWQMANGPNNFLTVADQCLPGLRAMLLHAIALPENRGNPLAIFLIGVVSSLRYLGVDIDEATSTVTEMCCLWMARGDPASQPDHKEYGRWADDGGNTPS